MVGSVPLPVERICLFQLYRSDGGVSALPVERICLFQL